ncbi:MAG: hypothetical protein DMD87_24970 [Candidatus Rokuibacteriota bacterium]|nr:MAG: hypothetical protein DMD87_24970 [Candidatus Rokubacteria bacterium]
MLELPPETVYSHVYEGWAAVAGLCVVLFSAVAWRSGYLETLAPLLVSGVLLAVLTPTVLVMRRRYRHVMTGVLVLAVMLGLLAAAINRYGSPAVIAFVVGPTRSASADGVSPR